MARSSGELWFEMGVRDKVQEALKKDIELSEKLEGRFDSLVKKYSALDSHGNRAMGNKTRKEMDELVKSSDKYLGVLQKIKIQREKLLSTRGRALSMGIDTKELDSAIAKLNAWSANYSKIAKKYGTDSAMLATKTGQQFRFRMQWIDDVVRSYGKLINVEEREAVAATQNLQRANQGLSASYDKVTQSAQKNMSTLAMLRQQAGYYFSLFGAKTLLQNVITIGGQFEYQETALKNIIGNAQQAKAVFSELKDLAIESPKTFMELTTTAKQLSAYQTPTRELFDTTKRLSDLSVGLGVDVNRLVLAFGQVRAAAVLRGQELRQFTEAGIPIVQALADKFTQMNGRLTTTADVFKLISARAVPFEMVRDVLWEMTSEGGRFYNMQAEMADTLYGKWQKLADIWQITLGDLAQTNMGGFKPFHALVDALVFAARNLQKLLPVFSAFAMSKGLRALASTKVGMFSIGGLDANIAKAQKLYDLELRRKFVNGEIKEDMYRQGLALNANKTNYYMQLAAEGKIHNQTIHRLIAEKKITEEKIQQGLANGTLLQQEANQLRLLMQQDAEGKLGGWRGMMRGAGASAMNMIGGPMGAIFATAGIWTSIYASYESWVSRIEERIKSAADTAKQNAQEIGKTLETYNKLGAPQDRKDLRGRIEQMKQVLEQSNLYSDTLREQVEGAASLNTQYDILIDAMGKLKAQQEDIVHNQKEMVEAVKKTGGSDIKGFWGWAEVLATAGNPILAGADALANGLAGSNGGILGLFNFFFNDDINKNLEQYAEYLQEVETQMGLIAGYRSEYEAIMAEMSKDKDFAMLINGKEPQEALTAIAGSKYWDEFIAKMGDSGEEFKNVVEKMVDSAHDGQGELDEIAKSDIPAMLESMAKDRNMELNAYIAYCKKHPEEAEKAVNRILSVLNVGGKALVGFANLLRSTLGLSPIGNGKGVSRGIYQQARMDMTEEGRQALGKLIGTAKGKGWGDKNGNGVWSSVWINNFFKKGGGYLEGLESIRSAWNSMAEERRAALAVGSTLSAAEEAEWQRLDKAAKVFGLKEKKSKNFGGGGKGGGGSHRDAELEMWKNRIQLLEKYNTEYEKYSKMYGEQQAKEKLKADGDFSALWQYFADPSDYVGSLRQAIGALGGSEGRRSTVDSLNAKIGAYNRKQTEKDFETANKELETQMKLMEEQFNLYKKIMDATNDKGIAASIAFGDNMQFETLLDYYTKELEMRGAGDIASKPRGEAVKQYGENSPVLKLYDAIRNEQKKMKEENVELYLEAYKNAKNYETQLKAIESQYEKTVKIINETKGGNRTLLQAAEDKRNKDRSKVLFDQFKENSNWGRIFADLDRISDETLSTMIENIKEFVTTEGLSVEETKALYEALEKLQQQETKRNPFSGISRYFETARILNEALASVDKKKGMVADDEKLAKALGVKVGTRVFAKDIKDAQMSNQKDFVNTINAIADAFKSLQSVLQPVIDLFDALGNETLSDLFSIGSNALGAAGNTASALGNLKGLFGEKSGLGKALGAAGPYAAAASAALSVVGSLFAQHDKKLEKSINRSKERVKRLQNFYKNVESQMQRSLGGIYTTGGYNDMLNSYKKQLKELQGQRRDEDKKKHSDKGKLADYDQQIYEMQQNIKHFAEDMAKSIYDIDVKSWAQQLTDAVVDAWAKGEDAAQAWHDKVKSIVNDLAKNILAQKVVEMAMQPVLDYVTKEMNLTEGKLGPQDVQNIAEMLDEAGKSSVNTITSILDYMKFLGYDLSSSASKEGNLSSAINSITEEAGDLLVSYVAAIRADVSANREQLMQICAAVQSIPELNIVAQSQLRQLEMIAANTGRNADSNDDILTIVRGFRDGLYSIKVK